MPQFIDRQDELQELNRLLDSADKGKSEFILLYGRRRVGKTTLLLHWAKQSNRSYLYWVARRDTAAATRQSLARAIWQWAYPSEDAPEPPRFNTWESLFEHLGRLVQDQPVTIILDEFSYAAESDRSLPSHVQAAWDHIFKEKPITLVLSGSHIGMMVDLLEYEAPLYGRFTGQLPLAPLPFAAVEDFFVDYSPEERVAAYSVLGGVAGYWDRFDPDQSLVENLRQQLFRPMGMFRSEPMVLISDLVRETRNYEAILRSIATGARTPTEIEKITDIKGTNLSPYLKRLVKLGFIERRLPVTIPIPQRRNTTRSRYHLSDPYLRFYFRFMEPNLELIEQNRTELLWKRIQEQFRAFIGATTWEELSREWVLLQANQGKLPFDVELVGSHWSRQSQVDVVAINWRDKAILLGECKWGLQPVGLSVIRELIAKTDDAVPEGDWHVTYAYFARAGFTVPATEEAAKYNALLIDLDTLDKNLRHNMLKNKPIS